MSERRIPTEPGWWWCDYKGVRVLEVYWSLAWGGRFVSIQGLVSAPVDDASFKWLEPVAIPDAVAAAVAALKAAAAEFHEHEWANSLKVQMEQAIAALTGGEGE